MKSLSSLLRVCALGLSICLFFAALSFSPVAANDAELDAANQAYTDQQFERSAELFHQIIASRGYSAALCYNLANADMKAGHVGQAILNYERARYLAPADSGIDHNLQLARKLAGLEPNSYRWWEIALRDVNLGIWLALMGGCLVLLFLAIIGSSNVPAIAAAIKCPPHLVRTIFRAILFVGIPLCLLLGYIELVTIGFNNRVEGVITAPKSAILRISPFDSSDRTGAIPEGELVTVEERHDNYLRIEARDHHFGWIRDDEIEPIVPGSFDAQPQN